VAHACAAVCRAAILHHDLVIGIDSDRASRLGRRLARLRVGQLLGLLFLIGPLADLVDSSQSPARVAAILITLAAFVAVYVVLLPPVRSVARRGTRAIGGGLALLAALAALTLALGAPRSFALLFVYVVAVAGIALPVGAAVPVIGAAAAAVGVGLAAAGSDGSTVAAWMLTVLGVGALTAALGSTTRANQELREVREELARLAVSEERLRIARDLHDLLGQTLSLIALKSELATRLVESDPSRAQAEMIEVQDVTRHALTEVREAVHGYRQLAFADALQTARSILAAAGIECRVDGVASGLPGEIESVLAWAVREATTNVVRHSDARTCAITLSTNADSVAVQVEDDGAAAPTSNGLGAGLAGLAERARRLNGALEAGARPEGGFRLQLTLPLRAP
jgi:two-component system, NarL family, sensor histidine kinase DesK